MLLESLLQMMQEHAGFEAAEMEEKAIEWKGEWKTGEVDGAVEMESGELRGLSRRRMSTRWAVQLMREPYEVMPQNN